ncbi:hypothetical protein AB3X94_01045 [Paraburkholderia sp. BR10923]|uniref:hypothetical protein n=1 Tax=Paraburkholderia sp. BR10923 TaxID=3236992 RepID=UPI0034CDCFFE
MSTITDSSNIPATLESGNLESFSQLRVLVERKARMVEAIDALPGQVKEARDAAVAAREAVTAADVAFIGRADKPSQDDEQQHATSSAELARRALECDEEARRLEARLAALEPAILQIDNEIEAGIQRVKQDAAVMTWKVGEKYLPELDRVALLLRPVMARFAALAEVCPDSGIGHLSTCYIPVTHHTPRYLGFGETSVAPNRLQLDNATKAAARAEVAPAVKGIRDALVLAATHKRYVPVSERPKPYVRKGEVVYESRPPQDASERYYR